MQWLDASRKNGALSLSWHTNQRRVFLHGGQIIATSAPGLWERLARVMDLGGHVSGEVALQALRTATPLGTQALASLRQIAEEDLVGTLVDLVPASGRFHWTEDSDRGEDEWVALELPLRSVLFETLRRMDEQPDVSRALPHEQLVLRAAPGARSLSGLQQSIERIVSQADDVTLSRVRLALGLSRSVVTRAVFDMLRAGRATVVGAAAIEADPIADMLEKGAVLVRERQFDAAALIFASLLQSDPGDRRVREFARMVEREHVAAIYREVPPVTRFEVTKDSSVLSRLRGEDRTLLKWFETGADVSAVVLASSQRELETLKAVLRLIRTGAVERKND